ncbi:porin family protein [Christiangramia aquimixticola]|uniref:porin family protein n=1 Tax=Christiangramia aquimixticola TaxID=1697558 RepID=UPI003AA9C079
MKFNHKLLIFFLFLSPAIFGQEERQYHIPDTVPFTIDSLYREDQFYVGFSFNLVTNKPEPIKQESFSGGLSLGFVRDFPVNEQRNIAIGIGAGWGIDSYGQNLQITKSSQGETLFTALDNDVDYQTNRFTTQQVELPLEFRWRTSDATTYKFWRVYTGVRFGYIYHFRSNYKDDAMQIVVRDLDELNRLRAGATFTFGYNTFNFQVYYSLIPFFKDAQLQEEQIEVSTFKIGLTFYIL